MSKSHEAFSAGRTSVSKRLAEIRVLFDPVGQSREQGRLRALGKWRFILARGILGWGIPMFLWLVLSNLREDVKSAGSYHQSTFQHLVHSWTGAFFITAFLGVIVGFLAWRRLTSEVWPGATPDPESTITRLGSLGPRGQ